MLTKQPTISDVARLAEVSRSTVSHVLNGTRFVEQETRQRVLDAVGQLGYRPNTMARSLTTKRTGTVGMVISDASNFFFSEMLRGVEDVLRPAQYSLTVCNTDEILEWEAHYLDLLLRHRVDGIIAAATSQHWSALHEAEVRHTPIVFVDRKFNNLNGPYVGVDNAGGAFLGTEHLIQKGYRKIGLLAGFQRLSTMGERLAGFRRALHEYGVPLREEWVVHSPLSIEGGKNAMRQLMTLPEAPEAVFIANNLLTLGALLVMKTMGLRCPDDVAIVGFDDHPWAAVSDPPLTVVHQPARELGQVAAQVLCDFMSGNSEVESPDVLACTLVVRQSC
jgi:LacI family transcriptional regulator